MTPSQRAIMHPLAMSMLHVPYIWGGSNPSFGLDCSGLVIELLKSVGMLPRGYDSTAAVLWKKFPLEVQLTEVEFGDLIFFGPTSNTISHVAFCLGNYLMLEAGGGNSQMDNRNKSIQQNARVRIRPIDNRMDSVGFKRPEYIF